MNVNPNIHMQIEMQKSPAFGKKSFFAQKNMAVMYIESGTSFLALTEEEGTRVQCRYLHRSYTFNFIVRVPICNNEIQTLNEVYQYVGERLYWYQESVIY